MSIYLTDFVDPITRPLSDAQGHWLRMARMHRNAQTYIRAQGDVLTAIGGLEAFIGSGATMFSEAIGHYISISDQHMQLLDQAVSSAQTCLDDITLAVDAVAAAGLSEKILGVLFSNFSLDDVLLYSGDVIKTVSQHLRYSKGLGLDGNGTELLIAIRILTQFGNEIYDAVRSYLHKLTTLPVPTQIPQLSLQYIQAPQGSGFSPSQQITSFGSNPQNITSGSGPGAPTQIIPLGSNLILAELGGPGLNRPTILTNLTNAHGAGGANTINPAILAAQIAAQQYIQDHHLPSSTQVIATGRGQGAIVAQYLAENNNAATSHTVTGVITIGSAQIDTHDASLQHTKQYITQYDAIPLLSWYQFKPLMEKFGWKGALIRLYQVNAGGIHAREAFTNERQVPDLGNNPNVLAWFQSDHKYTYNPKIFNASNHDWLQQPPVSFDTTQIGPILAY